MNINICLLTVTIFLIGDVKTTRNCLYGWYLSEDETSCFTPCPVSQQIVSNIYCNYEALKSVSLSYNSSSNVLSMLAGDSLPSKDWLIPPCYNVTLKRDRYNVTSSGFVSIAPHLMQISPKNVFNITADSVTLCYPSSPQLLQCDVVTTPLGSYEIVNGISLEVSERNVTAFLGDFYIDEKERAVTCAESVTKQFLFTAIPRCNVMVLYGGDYRVNGDGSVTLLEANFTIINPVYIVNYTEWVLACVPLTESFLNCETKRQVSHMTYVTLRNGSVMDTFYDQMLSPGNYYVTINAEITVCVPEKNCLSEILIRVFYSFFFVSGAALIGTIIVRYSLFAQNYHSLCLLCHIFSLIGVYFFNGVKLFSNYYHVFPCYLIFALAYFTMTSTYLWLTVIAYDAWIHFSRLQSTTTRALNCRLSCWKLPDRSLKRFVCYNLYVWGVAFTLTAAVLIMDLVWPPFDFSFKFQPTILLPQYPLDYTILPVCFLSTWQSFGVLFSIPLSVFTGINFVFMGLTICSIRRAGLGTELVNHRRCRQLFEISMRMFILMGFCWIVNCACFFIGPHLTSFFPIWYVSLIFTSAQGFLISLIYCLKKETF